MTRPTEREIIQLLKKMPKQMVWECDRDFKIRWSKWNEQRMTMLDLCKRHVSTHNQGRA